MLWFQSLLLTVFSTVMIDKKVLTLKTLYLGTPCLFAALGPYNVMQRCSKCKGNKGKRRNLFPNNFCSSNNMLCEQVHPPQEEVSWGAAPLCRIRPASWCCRLKGSKHGIKPGLASWDGPPPRGLIHILRSLSQPTEFTAIYADSDLFRG